MTITTLYGDKIDSHHVIEFPIAYRDYQYYVEAHCAGWKWYDLAFFGTKRGAKRYLAELVNKINGEDKS